METKGVTCKIPLELHNRISEEIRETESTMSKFIERIITEHYEKGAVTVMEKGRTLAFQVSEELFQRVKEYLEAYEKAYHRRLTQKEFVVGLIEQALEEAEEEFEAARAAEYEEQTEVCREFTVDEDTTLDTAEGSDEPSIWLQHESESDGLPLSRRRGGGACSSGGILPCFLHERRREWRRHDFPGAGQLRGWRSLADLKAG